MKIAPIYDPEVRKPAPHAEQVDLRILFAAGTVLWTIAAVVYTVLLIAGFHVRQPLFVCLCGIGIGIALLLWELANRRNYRLLTFFPQS